MFKIILFINFVWIFLSLMEVRFGSVGEYEALKGFNICASFLSFVGLLIYRFA